MIKNSQPARAVRSARFRPTVIKRVMRPAAVLTLAAGLAACTSSHPAGSGQATTPTASGTAAAGPATPTASNPTASSTHASSKTVIISGLITFHGQLRLSGAQSLNMSFTAFPGVTSPKSSCAHIAAAGTPGGTVRVRQFKIPSPPAGSNVVLATEISAYRGPGTYQKASLIGVNPSIVAGNSSYNLFAAGATVTVRLNANGSGELTFVGAKAAKAGQPALSGTINWTCSVQ